MQMSYYFPMCATKLDHFIVRYMMIIADRFPELCVLNRYPSIIWKKARFSSSLRKIVQGVFLTHFVPGADLDVLQFLFLVEACIVNLELATAVQRIRQQNSYNYANPFRKTGTSMIYESNFLKPLSSDLKWVEIDHSKS